MLWITLLSFHLSFWEPKPVCGVRRESNSWVCWCLDRRQCRLLFSSFQFQWRISKTAQTMRKCFLIWMRLQYRSPYLTKLMKGFYRVAGLSLSETLLYFTGENDQDLGQVVYRKIHLKQFQVDGIHWILHWGKPVNLEGWKKLRLSNPTAFLEYVPM